MHAGGDHACAGQSRPDVKGRGSEGLVAEQVWVQPVAPGAVLCGAAAAGALACWYRFTPEQDVVTGEVVKDQGK